jgi:Holliday junction resolvase RusA-like endonuclease
MKPITFTVAGDPVPQPRARITTRGKFAHAYTPKAHPINEYRDLISQAAIAAMGDEDPTSECVSVVIDAVFTRPKSHMTKRGLKATAPKLPRPDCDNIAKGVLDSLALIVWLDDTQVQRLVVEKSYGDEARTTVRIQ